MSRPQADITRAAPTAYACVCARVSCARVYVCATYLRVKALPYLISKIYRIFFFMKSIYIILNSD
nr:MAG TPA: hypothetical protein [Microviridae sp.]